MARLRIALRDVPAGEAVSDVPVPRDYRHAGSTDAATLVALLDERVDDYRATVHRCAGSGLAATVAAILAAHRTGHLLVPHDLPAGWYAGFTGTLHRDSSAEPLTVPDIDGCDTVLTGCAVAIAETGTLVLDSGPGQGRRAVTLIPDHHICVVGAAQIAATVPEALTRLAPERPLTFISGPSATSDIEFDRVEGVHGPRRLDVVLAEDLPGQVVRDPG